MREIQRIAVGLLTLGTLSVLWILGFTVVRFIVSWQYFWQAFLSIIFIIYLLAAARIIGEAVLNFINSKRRLKL